jgi:hypothetical protein
MKPVGRVLIMAEMHGRDLIRRHAALGLLIALPLSFYLASAGTRGAVSAGGIGMAFAVSGAALFSILSSRQVDQRLVLTGYRPVELLLGRLAFLGPLGLSIGGAFSALMAIVSSPAHPWVMALGVAAVAVQSVAFGLAVGALVPLELEGTLVLIGVIGVQLAVELRSVVSKVLPFYGPRRLLASSLTTGGPIAGPLLQTAAYGVGLLVVTRIFVSRRVDIERHDLLD